MLILPQLIEVVPTKKTLSHYKSRGYYCTSSKQKIVVYVKDLLPKSNYNVQFLCDYCGNQFETPYYNHTNGSINKKDSCKNCVGLKKNETKLMKYGEQFKKIHRTKTDQKVPSEIVKEVFRKRNYIMIGEYVGTKCKIDYICLIHEDKGIQKIRYNDLQKGHGCKFCGIESRVEKQIGYNIDQVRDIFALKGCFLLSDTYKNNKEILEYICKNGHHGYISLNNLDSGYCKKCRKEKTSGENHWSWKGGITTENEKARKSEEYKIWVNAVMFRDNYTCQCCLRVGGQLNAHHILNFSDNLEMRTDINNGITLCEECHAVKFVGSFHNKYGTYNNTKKQLVEFINNKREELGVSKEIPFLLQ